MTNIINHASALYTLKECSVLTFKGISIKTANNCSILNEKNKTHT